MITSKRTSGWPALWALVIGFFMILVDSTIVTVATPSIMEAFNVDVAAAVWVTSAYLLAYAVPLLITGRLGDRFGPKPIYIIGLAVFTFASLLCGLSETLESLVICRVLQGLGAAMMTPQTMAVIMRTFPPEQRGAAMGLWGGIAGLALLVGPILGGLLVDGPGWAWIFFVNVPVGVIAIALVVWLVPKLPSRKISFDIVGMLLSAAAVTCFVFGLQEGEANGWGLFTLNLATVNVSVSIIGLIAAGMVLTIAFLWWESVTLKDPLVPLALFRDRGLARACLAIATVGFAVTAMGVPLFLYAQSVGALTPTQSALLLVPMAVGSALLSPILGPYVQRRDPRKYLCAGIAGMALAMAWFGTWIWMRVDIFWLLLPSALLGVVSAVVWGPLGVAATRDIDGRLSGAASGLYNTVRQLGSVLGSAAIASMMTARIAAELPVTVAQPDPIDVIQVQPYASSGVAAALGQSMLLPAVVLLIGLWAAWNLPAPRLKTAILQTQPATEASS